MGLGIPDTLRACSPPLSASQPLLTSRPCLTYARAPDSILYLATIWRESWRDINPLTHVQNVPINESRKRKQGTDTMPNHNLNLAAYAYRRAAYHAANGNLNRAKELLVTARKYDEWAQFN